MASDSKATAVGSLDRINLRLPAETFDDIDTCRAQRSGVVSRNTWITEAVEEKLTRERATAVPQLTDRLRHG
jgi:metal-responsive CopG/Arc/MetJ family transcriptional regulator